jgi:hypothetical protein
MRVEHDLSMTDVVWVMRDQPLTSSSKPEDTDTMRVKSKNPDLMLSLDHNVLANLMSLCSIVKPPLTTAIA